MQYLWLVRRVATALLAHHVRRAMRRLVLCCTAAARCDVVGRNRSFLGDVIGRNRALSLTISLTALGALASGAPRLRESARARVSVGVRAWTQPNRPVMVPTVDGWALALTRLIWPKYCACAVRCARLGLGCTWDEVDHSLSIEDRDYSDITQGLFGHHPTLSACASWVLHN